MSRRRETKQQRRVTIMEKRRKTEEKTEKIIEQRNRDEILRQQSLQKVEANKANLIDALMTKYPSLVGNMPTQTDDVVKDIQPKQ